MQLTHIHTQGRQNINILAYEVPICPEDGAIDLTKEIKFLTLISIHDIVCIIA